MQKRMRERFTFWLDLRRDDDFEAADIITELKSERRFLPSVRNGIRLIYDLRAGRVEVLRELFPWVFEAVASALQEERAASSDAIQLQLERIEKFLIEQRNTPIDRLLQALASGPKHLNVPQFAVPFDDEDDEITLALRPVQGADSAQNFVNSVIAISRAGE